MDGKNRREAFRERFLNSGLEDFTSEEALEYLLSFEMPPDNAAHTAAKLLDACGSFSAVLEAPYSILAENDLDEHKAILLKFLPQICRIYLDDKFFSENKRFDLEHFENKIIASFIGSNYEQVLLVLMDSNKKELYFGMINKGTVNASEIYLRKILEMCIQYHAAYAVIAHNHPSGIAFPSDKDIETTAKLKSALLSINVKLEDHYIIAANHSYSMAKNEDFFDIFI